MFEISAERGLCALITRTALWPMVLLKSNSASGSFTFFSSSWSVSASSAVMSLPARLSVIFPFDVVAKFALSARSPSFTSMPGADGLDDAAAGVPLVERVAQHVEDRDV